MVSAVWEIINITTEAELVKEMVSFEKACEKRVKPVEELLNVDVKSSTNEFTLEQHMAQVDSYRQAAVKIFGLLACFREHAKSPYFALAKGTEFERKAKQYQLIAPFEGMCTRYEGLVKSIDSRVNMVKALLKLTDERERGMR